MNDENDAGNEWSPSAKAFALAAGLSGHVEAIKAQFQGLWPDMRTYVDFDEQQQKLVAWFVVTNISDEDWDQAFDLESEFWDSVPSDQRDLIALSVTEEEVSELSGRDDAVVDAMMRKAHQAMRSEKMRTGRYEGEIEEIEAVCKRWGYGNVRDVALRLWVEKVPEVAESDHNQHHVAQERAALTSELDEARDRIAELEAEKAADWAGPLTEDE